MYPGSALLAMRALGQRAGYLFCDTDPESIQSLREAGRHLGIRLAEEDGVSAIQREAASAGPRPSDVLVHIDPVSERANAATAERLKTGHGR